MGFDPQVEMATEEGGKDPESLVWPFQGRTRCLQLTHSVGFPIVGRFGESFLQPGETLEFSA